MRKVPTTMSINKMKLLGLISISHMFTAASRGSEYVMIKKGDSGEVSVSFLSDSELSGIDNSIIIPQSLPLPDPLVFVKLRTYAIFEPRYTIRSKNLYPFLENTEPFKRPPKVLGQNHRKKSKQMFYRRTR